MKKVLLISLLFVVPFFAHAQDAPAPVESETPTAIGMPVPDTGTVVQDATITVEIPKAEYEALKKAAIESQRLIQRRNQLLLENERLAAELGMWKSRLERVLQCATLQEAIEELRAVLNVAQGQ